MASQVPNKNYYQATRPTNPPAPQPRVVSPVDTINFGGTSTTGNTVSSGTVTGSAARKGTVAGATTASGTVTGRKGSAGTVAGSSTTAGTVTGKAGKLGTTSGSSTTAGTATGKAGKAGSVTGAITSAGTITGTKGAGSAFSGTVAGFTVSAGAVVGISDQIRTTTTTGSVDEVPFRRINLDELPYLYGTAGGNTVSAGAVSGSAGVSGRASGGVMVWPQTVRGTAGRFHRPTSTESHTRGHTVGVGRLNPAFTGTIRHESHTAGSLSGRRFYPYPFPRNDSEDLLLLDL